MATNLSSQSLGKSQLVSGIGKPDVSDTEGSLYSDNSEGNIYQKNGNFPGQWESILKVNRINLSINNNTITQLTVTGSWVGFGGAARVDPLSSTTFTYSSVGTSILSPTGDGGFESSAIQGTQGFAANNWIVLNGVQGNKWYVGTTGGTGSTRNEYGAYISNNQGASNSYSIASASAVWFYRDVNIPPNTIKVNLSLVVRVTGELTFDYLRVYNFPTSQTLTAGSPAPGTSPWGTAFAASLLSEYSEVTDEVTPWLVDSINFDPPTISSSTQSRRLAFAWRNDGLVGNDPPASVDRISLTAVTPLTVTYTGSQSKFKALLTGSIQTPSATGIDVAFQISKNSVTASNVSENTFSVFTNTKDHFIVQNTFTLSTGDTVVPYLNNKSSNATVTINDLQLSIWEVPF